MDLASAPSPPDALIARSTAVLLMSVSQPQVDFTVNRRMVSHINHRFHPMAMRNRTYQPSEVGLVILNQLKTLGRTQEWLAGELGVSKNAVTKWIKTGQIARDNLPGLKDALELETIDELFRLEVREPTPTYNSKNEELVDAYWRASDEARSIVDKILFAPEAKQPNKHQRRIVEDHPLKTAKKSTRRAMR